MPITMLCPHCGESLVIPDQYAGRYGRCRYCGDKVYVVPEPPRIPEVGEISPLFTDPPPIEQERHTGDIVRRTEFAGAGCFQQGFVLACLGAGVLTLPTIIGPLILWPLGLWMLAAGGRSASWYECSVCGGRVGGWRARMCPYCRSEISYAVTVGDFLKACAVSGGLFAVGYLVLV